MKYEIQIGEMYNMELQRTVPKQTMIITEEQFQCLEHFANIEQDEECRKTYIINKCRFKIAPHFELKTVATNAL